MSGGGPRDEPGALRERREEIVARRQTLVGRLEDGYRRIEEARQQGADIGTWEGFWLGLLEEYETICDELRPAA